MTLDRTNRTELQNHQNIEIPTHKIPIPLFLMINSFETGGSERQFATLAGALDAHKVQVYLGCIMQRGSFLTDFGEVSTFGLGGSLYGLRSVTARIRLARHLRSLGIRVAHSFDFYTNLTLIPAARMARVPVVIGSQRQLGDLLTKAQSRVQVRAFRWCDAVVCNSKAAADLLIRDGVPEDRVVVIGNALPPAAFVETAAVLPRIPGRLRVGMIARMNAVSKNHVIFLRAAAIVRQKFPDVEFLLAGDGPLRPELERLVSDLSLDSEVRFLGDRRDIPAVLASMDVSVLPSASESLSNVILESMAAAVPVVANRVGGNPELLDRERGILLDRCDERAFADAIERLLTDACLRTMLGQNAKRFAKANFSLESIRTKHEELYQELLKKKTSKQS